MAAFTCAATAAVSTDGTSVEFVDMGNHGYATVRLLVVR